MTKRSFPLLVLIFLILMVWMFYMLKGSRETFIENREVFKPNSEFEYPSQLEKKVHSKESVNDVEIIKYEAYLKNERSFFRFSPPPERLMVLGEILNRDSFKEVDMEGFNPLWKR